MTAQEREEARSFELNTLLVGMQLGLIFAATYGDFLDLFEARMKAKIGECTEEDLQWAVDVLRRFEKRNA